MLLTFLVYSVFLIFSLYACVCVWCVCVCVCVLGKGGEYWGGLSYPLDKVQKTVTSTQWMSKNMGLIRVSGVVLNTYTNACTHNVCI